VSEKSGTADRPREHCGVIGIWGLPSAALQVHQGLFALQHRGQESAGIVTSDGSKIRSRKGLGLLSEAIPIEDLTELPGHIAIGHVRYSTTGAKKIQNIQPLVMEYSRGLIAVAHNGNLVNARTLRRDCEARGSIFQTSTDSEIVVHLLAQPEHLGEQDPLGHCMSHLSGAYSFVFLTQDALIAARDPMGFRPLVLGELDGATVVASETCALDLIRAKYVREIEPGEILRITEAGLDSRMFMPEHQIMPAHCIFEHIYFARPDSCVFGESVHEVRVRMGERLAKDRPAEADVVVAVPDSGNSHALGYARGSGIPLDRGFIRNHYVGRTFIMPPEEARGGHVETKLNIVKSVVCGKRVVVVDDSIIRGTTSRGRIHLLREAGAEEVHLRIAAPPCRHPCYFGIDFPTSGELVAAGRSVEEIRELLCVDSLGYQSPEGLLSAVSCPESYCTACFTSEYPVRPEENMDKYAMEPGARSSAPVTSAGLSSGRGGKKGQRG